MPKALTVAQKEAKILNARAAKRGEVPAVRTTTDRVVRRERGVFNGTQGKLKINDSARQRLEEAGWHLHIFNDTPGRVEEALSAGYEFVTSEEIGSNVATVVSRNTSLEDKIKYLVGTSEEGNGMYAYLMKTKQEYWEEDQAQTQKRNDFTDAQIKSGKTLAQGQSSEGFYDAGISMKR